MFNLKGIPVVTANLNKEVVKMEMKSIQGLILASIIVRRSMETTPPLTPVDLGNLRASWFTVTALGPAEGASAAFDGDDTAELSNNHSKVLTESQQMAKQERKPFLVMGFSAYYAPYVHEAIGDTFKRPQAGAKFLESALKSNEQLILKTIKETIQIR